LDHVFTLYHTFYFVESFAYPGTMRIILDADYRGRRDRGTRADSRLPAPPPKRDG
jgi:hypothetical protein